MCKMHHLHILDVEVLNSFNEKKKKSISVSGIHDRSS